MQNTKENKNLRTVLFNIAEAGNLDILTIISFLTEGKVLYHCSRKNYITVDFLGHETTQEQQERTMQQLVEWFTPFAEKCDPELLNILQSAEPIANPAKILRSVVNKCLECDFSQPFSAKTPISVEQTFNCGVFLINYKELKAEFKPYNEFCRWGGFFPDYEYYLTKEFHSFR